jgi:MFS family permease
MLCGLAGSQEMLIVARFIQGIGGAMTSAVILGMIITMFPEPLERGKAIGVYSFVASSGASIGLITGGILTQAINWHWIFFVNVPIGVMPAPSTFWTEPWKCGAFHKVSSASGRRMCESEV